MIKLESEYCEMPNDKTIALEVWALEAISGAGKNNDVYK